MPPGAESGLRRTRDVEKVRDSVLSRTCQRDAEKMFAHYLLLALRSLRRNKVLTALMVMAIAVGIGASMTTLTMMHLLSRDPLPDRSAHIFYAQVDANTSKSMHRSDPFDEMDYRSAVDLWSAHRADRQTLIADSAIKVRAPDTTLPSVKKTALSTTSDFFPMFEVPFEYGHGWSPQDDDRHARVAVISSALNDQLFGGADSVGRTLRLGEGDVRIVGVLAPWRPSPQFYRVAFGGFFAGKTAQFYGRPEDVFIPLTTAMEINRGHFPFTLCWGDPGGSLADAPCAWMGLWVELDSAAKVAAYREFLNSYAEQQRTLGRFVYTDTRLRDLMQWLDFNHVVPSDVKLQTWGAFAFLSICLFNSVGLLLAKFLRRRGEIGVRRAMGASGREVLVQFLIEAALIGLLGGICGWLLTLLGLWLVRQEPVPYADLAHLDAPMFATTFALSIAVSLLAGALPAWRASRVAPALQLKTL